MKRSNHRESIKYGVIKGYADRARALCDEEYIESEMENIREVFEDNGYEKEEIVNAMKETSSDIKEKPEEEAMRGIVVMPNVPGFTEKFNQIARKHKFRVANKAENKM